MRNKIIKQVIVCVLVVICSTFVYAQGYENILERTFSQVNRVLGNEYIVYGLTFLLMFMLMYAIYASALSMIRIFNLEERKISRSGKIVALSLAGLTNLAIFVGTYPQSPHRVLERILPAFGVFGGLVLALVVWSIVYWGFGSVSERRNWKIAFAAAGVAMIIAGAALSRPNIMAWGWVIALLFAIIALIGLASGRPGWVGGEPGRPAPSPTPPSTPPTPPPDFTPQLDEIENLLGQYDYWFNQFKRICDDILLTNHHHRNPPVSGVAFPVVSNEQWMESFNCGRRLSEIHRQITSAITELMNHSDFRNITRQQKIRLVNLLNAWSSMSVRTQNYMRDFENRFNNGDPPA